MLVKPASYRAARDFTFQTVNYPKGAPISTVLIKTIPHLSALLSRRYIEPVPDPHQRRGPWRHQPVITGPWFFRAAGTPAAAEASPESTPTGSGDAYADYPEAGTIADVKAWVGTDKARASYALDHEDAKPNPRVTLLDYLIAMTEE